MIFYKMQGIGNDYIYLNCTNHKEPQELSKLAITLSNRNFGIGADGLILLCDSNIANLKMRMFNNDGSEAKMCGNGIRCVAKLAYELGIVTSTEMTIETLAGIKKVKLNMLEQKIHTVTVEMREPCFIPEKIPIQLTQQTKIQGNKIEVPIMVENKLLTFICISMGNPHAVTFVENVEDFPVKQYGAILEKHSIFPERANIEFVQIINNKMIKMRVWERGTGETLACGTGACAAVVACVLQEKTNRDVTVQLPGGALQVTWHQNNQIFMTGSAVTVFKGEWINE